MLFKIIKNLRVKLQTAVKEQSAYKAYHRSFKRNSGIFMPATAMNTERWKIADNAFNCVCRSPSEINQRCSGINLISVGMAEHWHTINLLPEYSYHVHRVQRVRLVILFAETFILSLLAFPLGVIILYHRKNKKSYKKICEINA